MGGIAQKRGPALIPARGYRMPVQAPDADMRDMMQPVADRMGEVAKHLNQTVGVALMVPSVVGPAATFLNPNQIQ